MTGSATPSPTGPRRRRIPRGVVDAFIAVVVILFALDTLPCTPEFVRRSIQPVLNATGLWQGTWSLFAPIPDSQNHRLQADITLADGTHHVWNSPNWRQQSAWQRFTGHRESELLEKIWTDDNSAAWPGFSQYLVRKDLDQVPVSLRPTQMELTVSWHTITPPEGDTWSRRQSDEQERRFFTLIYANTIP